MFKSNIGILIKQLREEAKISQENLANCIGISRVTYINSENGIRDFREKEVQQICDMFDVSINSFKIKKEIDKYRDLKDLILYIATNIQDGVGKTVLNKLLYFSDFNYYEWTGNLITQSEYKKLPYGPVPSNINEVLEQMVKNGEIAIQIEAVGPFETQKILAVKRFSDNLFNKVDADNLKKRDNYSPYEDLPPSKEIVDRVLHDYKNWSARNLSNLSHDDAPYKATKGLGDIINPELVFYRGSNFVVNHHNLEK